MPKNIIKYRSDNNNKTGQMEVKGGQTIQWRTEKVQTMIYKVLHRKLRKA